MSTHLSMVFSTVKDQCESTEAEPSNKLSLFTMVRGCPVEFSADCSMEDVKLSEGYNTGTYRESG